MPCDYIFTSSSKELNGLTDLRALILKLCSEREGASICPSEVARAKSKDEITWRALMPTVRDAARELAREGLIRVTRKDYEFSLDEEYRGAIRLRLVKRKLPLG